MKKIIQAGAIVLLTLVTSFIFHIATVKADDSMYLDPDGNLFVNGRINDQVGQLVPVGTIQAYIGTAAPDGWLLCDGSAIPTGTGNEVYDDLIALVGANTPDLRGRFLRGIDDMGGTDAGRDPSSRTIGSYQNDAFQGHRHSGYIIPMNVGQGNGAHVYGSGDWVIEVYIHEAMTGYVSDGTNGTPRTANETRPENIAVSYIIKY